MNGLGLTSQETRKRINQFMIEFIFLEETPDIFSYWLEMVTNNDIKGKRSHHIRLLALMKSHNISHLLTFNPKDFIQLSQITIVQPQDIIANKYFQ